MKAYYEMSQAAQEANRAAGMDTGDIYQQLKLDTACDAVFESVNRAFAELEVAATLSQPALGNESSPFISTTLDAKTKVLS